MDIKLLRSSMNDVWNYMKKHQDPQTTQDWQNALDEGQELADKYPGRYGIFIGHVIGGYQAMVEKLQQEVTE